MKTFPDFTKIDFAAKPTSAARAEWQLLYTRPYQ